MNGQSSQIGPEGSAPLSHQEQLPNTVLFFFAILSSLRKSRGNCFLFVIFLRNLEGIFLSQSKNSAKTTLLVGFDSAWTAARSGSLIGVLHFGDGTYQSLGQPRIVDYLQAEELILKWQREQAPAATIILLDQPTIVKNAAGQRPVENIVGSSVSLRYGGMQPANTSREEMSARRHRFGGS